MNRKYIKVMQKIGGGHILNSVISQNSWVTVLGVSRKLTTFSSVYQKQVPSYAFLR